MKTLDRSTWKNISCGDLKDVVFIKCNHTEDEHFAFDSGVYAGEQETEEREASNPYSSNQTSLYEAWEAGYACSRFTESEMIARENEQ